LLTWVSCYFCRITASHSWMASGQHWWTEDWNYTSKLCTSAWKTSRN